MTLYKNHNNILTPNIYSCIYMFGVVELNEMDKRLYMRDLIKQLFEKKTSYGKIRGHQKNVVFETRDVS